MNWLFWINVDVNLVFWTFMLALGITVFVLIKIGLNLRGE